MALTRYKQSCSDRAAYTLVEIAVVVTIIGILATLAVGEFNFEVQESSKGELGACESADLGRKLSSDETIQTPNS